MVNIFGELRMEVFPMKWTLNLEHIDEAGILRSTVMGLIERPELTCEAAGDFRDTPRPPESDILDETQTRRADPKDVWNQGADTP
jgi:hypothetical protein